MGLFSSSLSSVRKRFIDIFSSRSNTTGSLGTASDGSQWEAVSKVIEVQDGKAVANYVPQPSDDGSEYPIAVINMPTQNNIITLEDTDIGSGVALWVQTSADWWMVSVDSAYNTIPGATNYTSAPTTFTGQAAYSSSTVYTSSNEGFSSATQYSQGPVVYSLMPDVYSSGVPNYTAGETNYTSSIDNFSSGPVYSSSTPFSSAQNFTSAQTFSSVRPYSAGTNYTTGITAFSQASSFTRTDTWNRWSPYTSVLGNTFTSAAGFAWNVNSFWTRAYTRSGSRWTRAYTQGGNWTRSTNFFRPTGYSVANFWNLAQNYFVNYTTTAGYGVTGSQPFTTPGPTTYTSAPRTYTAGTTLYTSAAPNFTSQLFYTVQGGTFTSSLVFSSTTPYTSITPYSSGTLYSAATNYFADVAYTMGSTYSEGSVYTSNTSYTSNTEPDSFSYSAILRISQSLNDVVSEISSAIVSTTQTIKSILVQTSGNQITAKAFSDITPITQIGDTLTYDATGVIINTRYGISISKAEYSNDEIASSVTIERLS
jgi:hypothetical protein